MKMITTNENTLLRRDVYKHIGESESISLANNSKFVSIYIEISLQLIQ